MRAPSEPTPGVVVVARLTASDGSPVEGGVVSFATKTTYGKVQFGSRPTDATGTARLPISDRRRGADVVHATYAGDEQFTRAEGDVTVLTRQRPEPALPSEGMLISPTPTFWIAAPFLSFFGITWLAFAYGFGYLVLWRLRRTGD